MINLKIINILFILNLCFSTISINFNQFKYVKEEINSIDLRIIDEKAPNFEFIKLSLGQIKSR